MAKGKTSEEGKASYHDQDSVLIKSTDAKFDKVGTPHEVGGHTANVIINKGWGEFVKYVKEFKEPESEK